MKEKIDRLFELLPFFYRQQDVEQGLPLKALLRVITEQVNVVEQDIGQLYENWFIETCEDWVVPYIGDLVGYEPVYEAGEPTDLETLSEQQLNKILIPRRDVANTIRNRRRKGTLALLELLARDVANWPARAVEYFPLLVITPSLNHLRLSPPGFKITDLTLTKLTADGVPEEIVMKLVSLKNQLFKGEQNFYKVVKEVIGLTSAATYKDQILLHALFEGEVESNENKLEFKNTTPLRGRSVDLRNGDALSRLNGPFDEIAHVVDIRRPNSIHTPGFYNSSNVGLFVWRLGIYRISQAPAYCEEIHGQNYYSFSVLGNDTQLYTHWQPEAEPTQLAEELNLPIPIRMKALELNKNAYYGEEKSFYIWKDQLPVPSENIVVADLSNWYYNPEPGTIVVDPIRGRIALNREELPKQGIKVTYQYGFGADLGSGEYFRLLRQPTIQSLVNMLFLPSDIQDVEQLISRLRDAIEPFPQYLKGRLSDPVKQLIDSFQEGDTPSEQLIKSLIEDLNLILKDNCIYDVQVFENLTLPEAVLALIALTPSGDELIYLNRKLMEIGFGTALKDILKTYLVGADPGLFPTINEALVQWQTDGPRHAIIEIKGNDDYVEKIEITLEPGQTLQIRAANRKRPFLKQLDWKTGLPDAIKIKGSSNSRFTLDGLLISGRGVKVEGELEELNIRHCTLVPGWSVDEECSPSYPSEKSILLYNTNARVTIEHSIVGSIEVMRDQVEFDPLWIDISDSILDATDMDDSALSAPDNQIAHAIVSIKRSTVIGKIYTHAIELGENSIFTSLVQVARRQLGCLRYCYVVPGSRTPRRYNCQPDLAKRQIAEQIQATGGIEPAVLVELIKNAQLREQARVIPQFNSIRYGIPEYCQLSDRCAREIKRGADDESEMGVFHNLFNPQREANLRARLEEYTPAGMNAGIIFAS